MKQLFETETTNEFVNRIHKLTPKTQAQWGKMNVSQMLAHAQVGLKTANGTLKPKSNKLLSLLFGKYFKKKILGSEQFEKNQPTFNEAKIRDERNFESEKNKLIHLIQHITHLGISFEFYNNGLGTCK